MARPCIKFPLIMAGIAFLCFLLAALLFGSFVQPLYLKIALLLLPTLILLAVSILAYTKIMSAKATTVLTVILSVVLFFASAFYAFILFFQHVTFEVTDIRYYGRAFSKIKDEDGVDNIFPSAIPNGVENVQFSYLPQFLQGGEEFKLSFETSENELEIWSEVLSEKAVWIGSDADWHNELNWSSGETDAVRYMLFWDGGYNHGEWSFVLIFEDENRIEFRYSDW